MKIKILIPVYNDWKSLSKLIEEYDVPEKIKEVKFPLKENLDSLNKKIQ